MLLPNIQYKSKYKETVSSWAGYNHNLQINAGELYDMTNLTSDDTPVLSTRPKRGIYAAPESAQGLIAKDALCYVDGPDFVINDYHVDMKLSTAPEDCPKTMVSMGAYVIILPDRKYINTADLNEFGNIDASMKTDGPVTFTLTRVDGNDYNIDLVSPVEPDSPEDGMNWVDTSSSPHVLKTWSATSSVWVSVEVTYIKIQSANIGKAFSQYDGVTISGLAGKSLIDYQTGEEIENEDISAIDGSFIIWEKGDDFIVVTGILGTGDTIANQITIERRMPKMDFIVERDNRIWGCRYGQNEDGDVVNEIYASKLGDFKNWNCYMGLSTDSYAASCGTDGRFTGAVAYKGYALFFKEDCIHKVYGTYPSNFYVQTVPCRGVMIGSERSLVSVNETLFYKSRMGICAYEGAIPVDISQPLGGELYEKAVAGGHGNKYYISMMDKAGVYHLFVYDMARMMWHREDNTHALCFCSARSELYFIDADDGVIKSVHGSGDPAEDIMEWQAVTGLIGINTAEAKFLSKIHLRLQMAAGAKVTVFVQYDSKGEWEVVCEIMASTLRSFNIPVRVKRCDHLRIRLDGIGEAKLFSMEKSFDYGSDQFRGAGKTVW